MLCSRRFEWDMGHRVPGHVGRCRTPHGHRYVAEVTCSGSPASDGMVIDFGVIKERVGAWIDENLDHTFAFQAGDPLVERWASDVDSRSGLRPFFAMRDPPTAEHIAELLFLRSRELIDSDTLRVVRVRVWETPNCWAEVEA